MYNYKTKGVCASNISFELIDNKVYNLDFSGGCPGNVLGLSKLVEGMDIKDVIEKLKGIRCGTRVTSCPDQLATALEKIAING